MSGCASKLLAVLFLHGNRSIKQYEHVTVRQEDMILFRNGIPCEDCSSRVILHEGIF